MNADGTRASDLVRHEGRLYHLDILALDMDDGHREAVHSSHAPCSAQAFWDEFSRRWPDEADWLTATYPCAAEARP